MTITKRDLENGFDDAGCYDMLSRASFEPGEFTSHTITITTGNDDYMLGLQQATLDEIKSIVIETFVSMLLKDQVERLCNHPNIWHYKLETSSSCSDVDKAVRLTGLIYGHPIEPNTILLCPSELYEFLKLHPKATAGVNNTYHILNRRIVQVTPCHNGHGFLIPKFCVFIDKIEHPTITYQVQILKEVRSFSIGELS